jgi:hypothetical protein
MLGMDSDAWDLFLFFLQRMIPLIPINPKHPNQTAETPDMARQLAEIP